MIFLVIIKKDGISFSRKYDIFLWAEKERRYFSKNIHGNMMLFVNVVFIFPINMHLPFCQNSKDDLFPKNVPKEHISGITEKDDIPPRDDDIVILYTFMETFFKCFPILISNKCQLLVSCMVGVILQ